MSAAPPQSRPSYAALAWLPIVVLALAAIYLPGLGNSLVFDDASLGGTIFQEYAKLLPLKVRTLSYGSFVWVQALLGEGWWKQRLVNLLIHAAVVVALWAFYREILRHVAAPAGESEPVPYWRSPALGLAVGFFALNPVAVYGVGYLIQRSILMATLFTVLALWLFARGLREKKPWLHALAIVSYAFAVLSKEHAVLAPLAALPVYILVARPSRGRLAAIAAGMLVLVAAAGGVLYLRYGEILGKPFDEMSHLYLDQLAKLDPGAQRNAYPLSIMNEAWLFFRYGFDWFLPWSGWMSINLRPPFPVTWLTFPQVLGAVGYVGVIVGGFWLLVRYRDGRALLGLCLLIPALLFATEFSTVWVQDPFSLYRSYLWAIGIPGLVFLVVHGPAPRVLVVVGVVLAVLLGWQATDRVLSMATAESVWTDAIRKLPDDPRAVGRWFPYLNRGSAYVDQGLYNLALRDFEASATLGDQGMGLFNAGSVLSAEGKQKEALAMFDRAEKEGYDLYNLPFQRGQALLAMGRVQEGYDQMQLVLSRSPSQEIRTLALLQLGKAAIQLRRRDDAVAALENLVTSDPGNKEGRYLLGMAYVLKGEPQRARDTLDPLLTQEPSARAYYARAMANYALRDKPRALADIDNALRMAGDNPSLREWKAKIEAMP
jgi:Tfp pilus assembly protein PilF